MQRYPHLIPDKSLSKYTLTPLFRSVYEISILRSGKVGGFKFPRHTMLEYKCNSLLIAAHSLILYILLIHKHRVVVPFHNDQKSFYRNRRAV